MHALHKILVYIPEVVSNPENYTREELIKEIRNYAVMNTEQFYFSVFDYRETETAGRWQSRYPLNVLFAKDNKTRFLQELSTTKDSQHERILDNLSHLKEMVGTDLVEIILEIEKLKTFSDHTEKIDSMAEYYLYQIAALLSGNYMFYSGFYNLDENRARIYEGDLEDVENSPNDWALVMFDYHI